MYHCLVKTGFPPVYASKIGSLCKSATYPVFFSIYKIPVLSFHAIGFPILLADSCSSLPAAPSTLALLHVAARCCLPALQSHLLSCFISLLTQCVPCGFSACKKGWLKGMDPDGCHHAWEAFVPREAVQEQCWAVHLQQDGSL